MLVTGKSIGDWVADRTGGKFTEGIAIGYVANDIVMAACVFEQYNQRSIAMHIAGDRFSKEFLQYVFWYAFDYLKVNRVIGNIDSTNAQSIKWAERIGAKLNCAIPECGRDGDMLIYSLTRQNCRYLRGNHESEKRRSASTAECAGHNQAAA